MPEVLPGREEDAGGALDLLERLDREVEQLRVAHLAHARVGSRGEHALAADDALDVAHREWATDPEYARPVDLLLHPDREGDRLAVGGEAGRGHPFDWC